jgi:hypothetical protein
VVKIQCSRVIGIRRKEETLFQVNGSEAKAKDKKTVNPKISYPLSHIKSPYYPLTHSIYPLRLLCIPLGGTGDFFAAELSMGDNTSIIPAAVNAAYLPTFISASFRVIFSSLPGMFWLFSKL